MEKNRHGFVITKIKCSGCSFDGRIDTDKLHPDLQLFASLAYELFKTAFKVHQASREKCSGGRMIVSYTSAVSIFMDGKG